MTFRRDGLQVLGKDKTSSKTSRTWERIYISKGQERIKKKKNKNFKFSKVNESKRVRQDLATEQQKQSKFLKKKGFEGT